MNETTSDVNRIYYFDFLRLTAISMVILLHVASGVTDTMPDQMTLHQVQIYTILKQLMSAGVPIFLMISGALFLSPTRTFSIPKLFKKYVRRIVLALLIFGTAFSLIEFVLLTNKFVPHYIWYAFQQMVSGSSWAHMWYLYALLGLYLFLPFTRTFTKAVTPGLYGYVLILLFIANSVIPFLWKSFGLRIGIIFPTDGIYLFYFLAGFYFHAIFPRDSRNAPFAAALICASALCITFNCLFNWGLDINYDSPFIVIISLCIFSIARQTRQTEGIATKFQREYFSMYLVHPVFLNLAYKLFHITPLALGGYLLIPVFFAAAFLLSLASAWIMLKIPFLEKYVL